MHVFMKHCFSSKRMLFPLLTLILPLHYDFALYITDFFFISDECMVKD